MLKINSVRDLLFWLGHNLPNTFCQQCHFLMGVSRRKLLQVLTDVGTQRDPLQPVLMDFKDTILHYFLKHILSIRWFWC